MTDPVEVTNVEVRGAVSPGPTRDERLKILRSFILEGVVNSHAGLKSCWTVLFAGGTFNYILSLDKLGGCSKLFHQSGYTICQFGTLSTTELWAIAVLHLAYLLTFIRFYVGGIRVFDIKYNELFKFSQNIIELPGREKTYGEVLKFNDNNIWKAEVLFLTIQTLYLISLTFHLGDVRDSIISYAILLFMNSAWLVLTKRPDPVFSKLFFSEFPELRDIPCLKIMFPRRALGAWAWNNLITAILLFFAWIVLHRDQPLIMCDQDVTSLALLLSAVLMVINSAIDFGLTWSFYFPQFAEAYERLSRK